MAMCQKKLIGAITLPVPHKDCLKLALTKKANTSTSEKVILNQSKLSILMGLISSATLKCPTNRAKKTICCSRVNLMFSACIQPITTYSHCFVLKDEQLNQNAPFGNRVVLLHTQQEQLAHLFLSPPGIFSELDPVAQPAMHRIYLSR